MSHISAIVCNSNINGCVFVNGFSQGTCTKDTPVSIPWDGKTPLFISFTPEGGNYLTTSLAFTSMNSLPLCDNAKLTLWTGVVEINFKPRRSVIYPPPLLPEELLKESFAFNETSHTISLIDYCGIWLIIDTNDNTCMCEYLGEKVGDENIDIISQSPVLIHIRTGDIHYSVTHSDDKFTLHNIGKSKCTIDGNKLSFTSDNPLLPICTEFNIENDIVTSSKFLSHSTNASSQDIAVNFLSNVISKDLDAAYSMLSVTLQRSFTKEQIADFIGNIHTIVENKYFSQAYDNSLAVLSTQSDNVDIATAYAFEIDSKNKINNITPL